MAINKAYITKQLVPGLNAILGLNYKEVPEEHKALFDVETSDRAFEEEVMMTDFETAPYKLEGEGVQYFTASEAWTARYTHRTLAMAYAITEEALEDNLYDTFTKIRTKAMGRSMGNSVQTAAADIFNRAFNASYTGGDGAALCATHTLADGSTIVNNVSTDLSEAALETAVIAIAGWTNDKGILIAAEPVSLHIPRNSMFIAKRILGNPNRPSSADHDINALYSMNYLRKGGAVNHRFTDTNAWFIRTDVPDGTKMFVRKGLEAKMEGDFDTGNMRYKCRQRFSFGWSNFRGVYGSAGSS